MNKKTPENKKNTRDASLIRIARIMLTEPVLALDSKAFIKKVADTLDISKKQAKKDINEILKRETLLSDIDYKKELAKKIKELAFVKEASLQNENINAYLGALKLESELLGLGKLNIIKSVEDDEEVIDLEKKKEHILKEFFNIQNENN